MHSRFGNSPRDRRLPPPRMVRPPVMAPPKPSTPDMVTYPKESFAPIELAPEIRQHLKPVKYDGESPMQGRVNTIEGWDSWDMGQRLKFLREFVKDTARDPAIAAKTAAIIRSTGKSSREHQAQWAALLKFVQRTILYVNEPNERIQSAQYTLTERHGDCDDCAIALATLGESVRLPWRFVISGRSTKGERTRYVEGTGPVPRDVVWSHIYLCVGWPPFQPTKWTFAEPTLDVPLGWDTIAGRKAEGRADMAGRELAGSFLAASAPDSKAAEAALKEAEQEESIFVKARKNIPWWNVIGTVLATVTTAVIVKSVVEPRLARAAVPPRKKNPKKRKAR